MDFYDYYNPYELTHWGIKGMKWGVRRFQNKDGSLTMDGGKRYNGSDYQPRKTLTERYQDHKKATQRKKSLEKARATKEAKKKAEEEAKAAAEQRKKDIAAGKIKTKYMTDEEIKYQTERLKAEKNLNQLMDETGHSSKLMKTASKTVSKFWKETIMPAATEAAKQKLKDAILDANKKPLSESEVLEQLAKDWKNKADIAKNKKSEWENTRDFAESKKKYEEHLKKDKSDAKQSKKDTKAEKTTEKQSSKKEKKTQTEKTPTESSTKQSKTEKQSSKTETWTGTVEGEGTSKFTGWDTDPYSTKGAKNAKYTTVDPGTAIVPTVRQYSSQVPSQKYITSGESIVTALLEDRNK